jgi:8-oxo-dGTP diphosphatase
MENHTQCLKSSKRFILNIVLTNYGIICDYLQMSVSTVVRVGVGVFVTSIKYPGCVLVGERIGSHGSGTVALPGGHLEMGESWETCGTREIKEETNLDITSLVLAGVTNDVAIGGNPNKHYITIFMQARLKEDSAALENLEPHKCKGWNWTRWDDLFELCETEDERVFDPLKNFIRTQVRPSYLSI